MIAVLAPFALYSGWSWVLARESDRRLEAALYTTGLTGALFVIPAALLAAATVWLIRSGRVAITPLTAAVGIVIAGRLALPFGAGLGSSAAARWRSH